ncbi:hypothetical protein DJ021_13500 [Phenylobacterium hankyongense]|uniref:Uncharacterized protein n=1 Tax=Phenylobacterium hankyongense TaxID=1813876 RepID=A0A328B046_9CAUL|nr:hypothetical protein [Phenylobacterium hankyongense]RAK60750.1 hypothetical protein DJ021_13500 [Phenylobacterium hankyongense]
MSMKAMLLAAATAASLLAPAAAMAQDYGRYNDGWRRAPQSQSWREQPRGDRYGRAYAAAYGDAYYNGGHDRRDRQWAYSNDRRNQWDRRDHRSHGHDGEGYRY